MPKISAYPENTFPSGRAYIVVDANVSDHKYKAQYGVLNLLANRLKMLKQEHELDVGTVAQMAPFDAVAIGAGTFVQLSSEAEHPGIWRIAQVGANTGYYLGHNALTSVLIGGGETAEFVVRLVQNSNMGVIAGFFDNFGASVAPNDAVGIYVVGNTLTGRTTTNLTVSTTGTNFLPSANTWYRLKLVVNDAATRVDFYVYDTAGAVLWTDFLTTNIPTAAGRECCFGIKAYRTAAANANIFDIDWMAYYNAKALTR